MQASTMPILNPFAKKKQKKKTGNVAIWSQFQGTDKFKINLMLTGDPKEF